MQDIFIDGQADPRDKISLTLKELERSKGWLSRSVNMSQSHLIRILNKERPLTQVTLDKINEVLKTDFKL